MVSIANAQHRKIFQQALGRRRVGRVLGADHVDDERQGERRCRHPEDVHPAKRRGEARREERCKHSSRVTRACNPQRDALILGRVPARSERQRDRERSAGDTQHDTKRKDLAE
jgi:hypothetical protein